MLIICNYVNCVDTIRNLALSVLTKTVCILNVVVIKCSLQYKVYLCLFKYDEYIYFSLININNIIIMLI